MFVDGASGTTGLDIAERLARQNDVVVKSIADDKRKDAGAKRALMEEVDLVILCLPDDCREGDRRADRRHGQAAPKVLDASTAFRVAPDWTYGFPELAPDQADKIRAARKVSNPGCYPTGAIALLRPLVDAGLMPAGLSRHRQRGQRLFRRRQVDDREFRGRHRAGLRTLWPRLRAQALAGDAALFELTRRPIFVPSVGNFRQGMLVSVPLHLDTLPGSPTALISGRLAKRYAGSTLCLGHAARERGTKSGLEPEALNDTNRLELHVFASESTVRPCWSRVSTISAKAPRAPRCRTCG